MIKNQKGIEKLRTITKTKSNVPETAIEFLKTAAKLIPEYDGKADNLQRFLDVLCLGDSIKETHKATGFQ